MKNEQQPQTDWKFVKTGLFVIGLLFGCVIFFVPKYKTTSTISERVRFNVEAPTVDIPKPKVVQKTPEPKKLSKQEERILTLKKEIAILDRQLSTALQELNETKQQIENEYDLCVEYGGGYSCKEERRDTSWKRLHVKGGLYDKYYNLSDKRSLLKNQLYHLDKIASKKVELESKPKSSDSNDSDYPNY